MLFDLTLPQDYPATFADLGVTLFGHALNAPGGAQFGHQVQFADQYEMAGLAPGTYLDQRIDLDRVGVVAMTAIWWRRRSITS